MQIRYFMEMIFFFALSIYFQKELLHWLDNYNFMRSTYSTFLGIG